MAKKILVVDDERPLANALKLKLEHAGYEVDLANNGTDAISALKDKKYDLTLLDLIMPETDGFSVLEKIKELKINTPVIVSSNLSQPEDLERAKNLGAIDYFIKSDTSISKIVELVGAKLK